MENSGISLNFRSCQLFPQVEGNQAQDHHVQGVEEVAEGLEGLGLVAGQGMTCKNLERQVGKTCGTTILFQRLTSWIF